MPLTTRPTLNFLKSVNTLTDDDGKRNELTTVPERRPDRDVKFQSYAFDKALDNNRSFGDSYGGVKRASHVYNGNDPVCCRRY